MRVENFALKTILEALSQPPPPVPSSWMYDQKILAPHELYKKCSNRFWRLQLTLLRSTSSIQWKVYVQTKNTSHPMSCTKNGPTVFFRVSNGSFYHSPQQRMLRIAEVPFSMYVLYMYSTINPGERSLKNFFFKKMRIFFWSIPPAMLLCQTS